MCACARVKTCLLVRVRECVRVRVRACERVCVTAPIMPTCVQTRPKNHKTHTPLEKRVRGNRGAAVASAPPRPPTKPKTILGIPVDMVSRNLQSVCVCVVVRARPNLCEHLKSRILGALGSRERRRLFCSAIFFPCAHTVHHMHTHAHTATRALVAHPARATTLAVARRNRMRSRELFSPRQERSPHVAISVRLS